MYNSSSNGNVVALPHRPASRHALGDLEPYIGAIAEDAIDQTRLRQASRGVADQCDRQTIAKEAYSMCELIKKQYTVL